MRHITSTKTTNGLDWLLMALTGVVIDVVLTVFVFVMNASVVPSVVVIVLLKSAEVVAAVVMMMASIDGSCVMVSAVLVVDR